MIAFVAAHILRGQLLLDLGLPTERSVPLTVSAETDAAVDDVQVTCEDGGHAYLQVKTRLTSAKLDDCVKQWIEFATSTQLDPTRQRILACGGTDVTAVRALQGALRRHQQRLGGAPTKAEADALDALRESLASVPVNRRDALLACADVWIADFRGENELQQKLGAAMLDGHVVEAGQGLTAWLLLREHARLLSSQRGGADLDALVTFLRTTDLTLVADASASRAAARVAEQDAVADYRSAVVTTGRMVSFDGVGAGIPPIPLEDLDMSIDAASGPPADDREAGSGYELPWLARAYGRTLLCGPPGSGKSVALRAAAADYAGLADWPLPLVIDLPRWQQRRGVLGDRAALLNVAFEREPVHRRSLLEATAEHALDEGRAVLLLDSLDETGRARRSLVDALRNVLDRVHADVEVVLSTRDVGYADARTLGFADLSLVPPERPEVTITTVLGAVAVRDGVSPTDRDAWVKQRAGWVEGRLQADPTLRRTPLMVVLLTLLAATHAPDQLPRSRGEVLVQVIRDVISRWEHEARRKGGPFTLGPLQEAAALEAAQLAFAVVGHHVLRDAEPTADEVAEDLATMLAVEYGLPKGQAHAAAVEAVDLWDVVGVFVKEGIEERLRARVQSLAELAEALYVIEHDQHVEDWVAGAVAGDVGREPLQLAASLDVRIADALLAVAGKDGTWSTLKQVIEAVRAGAQPSPAALSEFVSGLQKAVDAETGEVGGWAAAVTLVAVPIPDDSRTDALTTLDRLPDFQRIVARAFAVDGWDRNDEAVDNDLRRMLDSEPVDLPLLNPPPLSLPRLGPDPRQSAAYASAAKRLVTRGNDALARQVITNMDRQLTTGAAMQMREMLADRGFNDLLETSERAALHAAAAKNMAAFDELLTMWAEVESIVEEALLARVEPAELTEGQRRRLAEWANLDQTLSIGQQRPGSLRDALKDDEDGFGHIADALSHLKTVDMPVAMAQLAELRQIEAKHGRRAAHALTSAGRSVTLRVDWTRLPDMGTTAEGLVDVVARGREWMALIAAEMFAGVPQALHDRVLERLHQRLTTARAHGLELLALIWLDIDRSDEARAEALADQRPPVRRGLAGAAVVAAEPVAVLSSLVTDQDVLVREMAVSVARRLGVLDALIEEMSAAEPPTEWECRWCASDNEPNDGSCGRCKIVRAPRDE
ncbi:MAG TPA: AAA family ATPase [Solirubrobacteraceae bacterium]